MPIDILMPALSPTMEKGNLSRWLKKEGDKIKPGDVLAEIETDKATMEVEAVDEGVLAKIVVPDGTNDVPVNDVIGVIAGEGEDAKSVAVSGGAHPPLAPPAGQQALLRQVPVPALSMAATPPHAGPQPTTAALNGEPAPRIFASPLARRIAKDSGLDLAAISGTGPHGRIIERDVKAALARAPSHALRAPPAPQPATSDEAVKQYFSPGSFDEIPHDSMRKTIARRLIEASQTIPHFYLAADCNLDALAALREAVNAAAPKDKEGNPAYKISVNDFFIKALALALMRVPEANVTWTETALLKHKQADIGVAVAIPGGLITPIVRAAETKRLSVISNEMKDFSARARARKLKPEDYQGGSAALSNLGMFGIKSFSAIINPPQATILAVGAAESRVIVKDGAPCVAAMMSVTLSCDHRAVDGVLGAKLLAAFKDLIEKPAGMLA
ncbi:MAG: pyruvate dehydrogenase complex dihydrolipoamide acetyltransferase [Beijerinckiaceae bacterium]|nr:pyruvate dehydrogenase complex dihydrolipoamide acetyltransferase [Beijerinckiaceae bacterium]MCI0736046.1 pyruvate dehydrogenase complex dihydrolipoamide acetyltransferase [Beijerinckiaceae bacterium]